MRYADMRGHLSDTTKTGKLRKAAAAALHYATLNQPPATPARPPTGAPYDRLGNVYALHSGTVPTQREVKRANKSGRGGIAPLRSRIQRTVRRRRTGGIK